MTTWHDWSHAAPGGAPGPRTQPLREILAAAVHKLIQNTRRPAVLHIDETTPDHVLRDLGILDGRERIVAPSDDFRRFR